MDFKTIPLLDNYETTLAQEWDWQVWKIKVDDLPNVAVNSEGKFEWWFTTYIIVNPDKVNFQLAEIDGYDAINKTLNVININLLKWLWVNYNLSHHNQKSIVRISNNFAFWKKLSDVLNSKADYGNWTIFWDYFLNIQNWNLKFKDKDNVEISLTDIAWKIGQDKKVSITWEDEASFLQNKIWKGLKVVWDNQNKKIDVDYGTIDFSWLPTKTNLEASDFLLTSNKKKIPAFSNFATDEEVKNLSNLNKNLHLWHLLIMYSNINLIQKAIPSNTIRLSSDNEVYAEGGTGSYGKYPALKSVVINCNWTIKLSFEVKKDSSYDWTNCYLSILKNNSTIHRINIINQDYQTKTFNIDVQNWDIIKIKKSSSEWFKVRNFRICFDYQILWDWEILTNNLTYE